MCVGIREETEAGHNAEGRMTKSPRMIHKPYHRVTRNRQHTDLSQSSLLPRSAEITIQMYYVIDKWSEEIVKMDYIPSEYFQTAIEHRNVSEFNPHVKDKPGKTYLGNGQCYRLLCQHEAMVMLPNQALQVSVECRACEVKWR